MSLRNTLIKIDALKSELEALPSIKESDERRLLEKFRLEWNYNSNHIEGNTLTYGETMLLLIKGKTTGDHDIREYDEMKAHDLAIEKVREWAVEIEHPFTTSDICNLNKIILVRPFYSPAITPAGQETQKRIIPGEYKTTPNSVRLPNGEMFHYAEPTEVSMKMQELLDWYHQKTKDLHPVIVAAKFHYEFVLIHPFDDGNGRVARLIMNYHLLRNGYPPIVIKSDDKKNYLTALGKADAGDFESFANYIGEQLEWSLDLSIIATKGESIEEEDDWEKELNLLRQKFEFGKKNNESEKNILRQQILATISSDVPIILNEIRIRFNPLAQFFKVKKFYISPNTQSTIKFNRNYFLPLEEDAFDSIPEDLINVYSNTKKANTFHLSFQFNFSGFLYLEKQPFRKNWLLNLFFTDTGIQLSSDISGIPIIKKDYGIPINKSELTTISELARQVRSSIEIHLKEK